MQTSLRWMLRFYCALVCLYRSGSLVGRTFDPQSGHSWDLEIWSLVAVSNGALNSETSTMSDWPGVSTLYTVPRWAIRDSLFLVNHVWHTKYTNLSNKSHPWDDLWCCVATLNQKKQHSNCILHVFLQNSLSPRSLTCKPKGSKQ